MPLSVPLATLPPSEVRMLLMLLEVVALLEVLILFNGLLAPLIWLSPRGMFVLLFLLEFNTLLAR